jgi:hypothetical protein
MDFGERYGMTDFGGHSPRRYFVDKEDRHVLIGLTIGETFEFETLDSPPALDESGNHMAWDRMEFQPSRVRSAGWNFIASTTKLGRGGWPKPTRTARGSLDSTTKPRNFSAKINEWVEPRRHRA